MVTIILLYCLLFFPTVFSYTDESINLLIRSTLSTSNMHRYCIELAKLPNNRTVDIKNFGWHSPYLSSPSVNACNISSLNESLPNTLPSNTTLIIYEHECKMTEHAWNIEKYYLGQQISLMIIINRTNTRYELSYNATLMPVTIPVLIFWRNDFIKMNNKYENLNNIELSIDYPFMMIRKFRPAILLMFLLVLFILLCGNFWAADEFKNKIRKQNLDTNHELSDLNTTSLTNERSISKILTKQNSITPNETSENNEPAVLPMTCCAIILIICFAVGWLLLLYYFPKVMIYILQVIFCIGAFSSLTSCFDRLSQFVPYLRRYSTPSHTIHKPCVCQLGPLNMFTLFAMSISLTLVIIWYVYRHTDWAWILQNILGAAICITVTSIYRLGNMRAITIILLVFFLYDIFFVFITPYIPIFQQSSNPSRSTKTTTVGPSTGSSSTTYIISRKPIRNPSVMEQVALGIGTNGEVVPLLFILPAFIPENEIDPCATIQKSMLGYGDIILPGILLTFCKIFDIASNNRWPIYYTQSIVSYFIGLSVTHVALYLMNTAQPALLYLVPCLLLSTIITGLCRRELKELYTGRRIQLLLDGTIQNSTSSLHNGIDNPIGQQINDEIGQSDTVISVSDKTNVNHH
ncbi:unnamed protein product [Rotaria sp. Silwood1]|nr:unnamed protein product [Rotaria sp. Silwood1]CAF1444161.1 unnamed protein product [Rotaria sp. Silwood1]CAF3603105.1 unnamed protein product [Rotaria sp. Silwood1]CAF3640354.1 unnamed protein product [Rotaria sp. Silwood1]CAF4662122.1 unnamed protein product [Rotaria sp. Silwood1]